MNAELVKIRALPTPRWTAVFCLVSLTTAVVVSAFTGIGEDDAALGLGASLPTLLAAILLGAWIVGLEYGQRTMARSLSADPRRVPLVVAKLAAAALVAQVLTAAVYAIAAMAFPLLAEGSPSTTAIMRSGLSAVVGSVFAVALGVSLGLISRSMAGAITAALVLVFVIEGPLSAVPHVGDLTFFSGLSDVDDVLAGTAGVATLLSGALIVGGWLALLLGSGLARFARTDA